MSAIIQPFSSPQPYISSVKGISTQMEEYIIYFLGQQVIFIPPIIVRPNFRENSFLFCHRLQPSHICLHHSMVQ